MNRAPPFDQASRSLIDRRGNNPVSAGGELRSKPPKRATLAAPRPASTAALLFKINGCPGAPIDADGFA